MKAIFKDSRLHDEYEQNGFVTIPLLNQNEIRKLKELYVSFFGKEVKGLYTTHSHSSGELNIRLHHAIGAIMRSAMENIFYDFDFVVNHFVVKSNVKSEELKLHQDWSIVEEEKVPVAQLWCPLEDVGEHNGGMFAVKGSHRFFDNLRSGSLGMAFINRTPVINNHLNVLNVKAGEALVFKMAVFHGSFPNQSVQSRMVAFASIVEKNQPWVYYQKHDNFEQNKIVDVYAMNTETFLSELASYEKGIRPVNAPCIHSFVNNRVDTRSISDELFSVKLNEKISLPA